MGGSKDGEVVGYKYFLGVDFKWCYAPIDSFRKFYIDNRLLWEGSRRTGSINVNKPELFGEFEGGVAGKIDIAAGEPDQLQNAYLVENLGSGVPAYRGVTSTILNQVYLGNNPYLKGWTAEVSRIHRRLMNGTAIVQWQDDYAAVPPFSNNEDGYSSLSQYYGSTLGPQQILIQIDLSSDANGFKNQFFTINGAGQDIVATKASVIGFLLFLRDQAEWEAGDLDLGIAYFRATNGATNNTNNKAPSNTDPTTLEEGVVYEAARRGVLSKVGLTKADIPELIEFVQSLVVYPDTTDHTSLAILDNVDAFFGPLATTKRRVNFVYSTFDFEESVETTSENIGNINDTLNNGVSSTKVALSPESNPHTPDASLPPHRYWYGYTSTDDYQPPTGWVEVTECNLGQRSTVWAVDWGTGNYADAVNSCAIPSGWGGDPKPVGSVVPSNQTLFTLLTLQQGGIYDGRYYPFRLWVRQTGTEPWSFIYERPDGTFGAPNYYVGDTTNYNNNPTTPNYLENLLYNVTLGAGLDMNPAHIIRECLTDQQFGLGIPESEVDETSFFAAAVTLYNERFGLSMAWNRQTDVEEFIQTILNHIDAVLYVRRDTGKWTLKLIRDDYNESTLPEFTDDDVVSWDQVTRKSEAELVNSVTIKFNSRSLRGPASLTVNNLAQIQQLGAVVPTTVNYPAIWQQGLASVVAARDLRSLSSATISGSIRVTRKGAELYPADVFKLTSSRYNLNSEIMRVVEVNIGDGKDNAVYIKFVQDVFALGSIPITEGAESEWDDVLNEARPVEYRVVEEESYRSFVRRNGEQLAGELYAYDNNLGYIAAFGQAPTGDSINARISYDIGSGYTSGGFAAFCPTADLLVAVERNPTDTTWTLTNTNGLSSVTVNSLAYINGECVRVDSVDLETNTVVVGRGCLDTIPLPHAQGSKVFFYERALSIGPTQFSFGDVANVKLLTNAGLGQLEAILAPTDVLTFNRRIDRPLPVGNLQINSSYDDLVYTGALNITWAHRDRTLQTGDIPEDHLAANIGPEAGVTYTVKGLQYNLNNEFVSTLFSISAGSSTSQSVDTTLYPMTTTGYVRIMVESVRGGLTSRVSPYIDYFSDLETMDVSGVTWHDVNDISSLFENADGTSPVTTNDQPVGRIDNKLGGLF